VVSLYQEKKPEGSLDGPSEESQMAVALLKTKLYVPPLRPGLVSRRRLVERLDEGLRLGHRLTLVSAPAGFGKTMLLSEWAHGVGAALAPPQMGQPERAALVTP